MVRKEGEVLRRSIVLAFGVFYVWMAAQIPYTHDDWDWGISNGIYQLVHASLNGRYAGNLFEVIMTRSELAKTGIMGACFLLLPLLMAVFAAENGEKRLWFPAFLACNGLLLTMSRTIWQQTYGWIAGFANYGVSAVFLMAWIREIGAAFQESPAQKTPSRNYTVAAFGMAVAGQLFLENLALYTVLLGIFLCFLHYIRTRKIPMHNLVMLAGAVIGLLITFSSGIYDTLWSTGEAADGVRRLTVLSGQGIRESLHTLWVQANRLTSRLYGENFAICHMTLLLISCLLMKKKEESTSRSSCILINVVLMLYFPLNSVSGLSDRGFWWRVGNLGMVFGYFAVILVELWMLYREQKWRMARQMTLWVSAPALIAPLIMTEDYGPRLFFTSNIFLILFAVTLLCDLLQDMSPDVSRMLTKAGAVCIAVLIGFHGILYKDIGACKRERDEIIQTAVQTGERAIELPAYPHSEYLWCPDPEEESRLEYFKRFYGLPMDTEIVFRSIQ